MARSPAAVPSAIASANPPMLSAASVDRGAGCQELRFLHSRRGELVGHDIEPLGEGLHLRRALRAEAGRVFARGRRQFCGASRESPHRAVSDRDRSQATGTPTSTRTRTTMMSARPRSARAQLDGSSGRAKTISGVCRIPARRDEGRTTLPSDVVVDAGRIGGPQRRGIRPGRGWRRWGSGPGCRPPSPAMEVPCRSAWRPIGRPARGRASLITVATWRESESSISF